MKFHGNFQANFRRKITGTKNEILAISLALLSRNTVPDPTTIEHGRETDTK